MSTTDDLSNRQRRLLDAISNLPDPWATSRPWRSDGEMMSRHLGALRARLDWLVKLEDEHGDAQRGVHQNRGERNALIWALGELAERAGIEAARPGGQAPGRKYDPEYVDELEGQIEDALAKGFTTTRQREPGVLYHRRDDVAPLQVPVPVWFAVRGYVHGQEDA